MTTEEAIKVLKSRYDLGNKEYMQMIPDYIEALGMAIDALSLVAHYEEAVKEAYRKGVRDGLEGLL